jgi:hypothetical protein
MPFFTTPKVNPISYFNIFHMVVPVGLAPTKIKILNLPTVLFVLNPRDQIPDANIAKGNLILPEFLELCKRILVHHGYGVTSR